MNKQKKSIPNSEQKTDELLLADIFQTAMQHHQSGEFAQADKLYRQILQQDPNNPDALHCLGLLAYQLGQAEIAVELIGEAISIYPNSCQMYCNLGLALQAQGKLEEAVSSYQNALSLQPDYVEAHTNLGNAYVMLNKFVEATESYRRVLSVNPNNAAVCNNLGSLLKAQGQLEAAVENFQQALLINPAYAEAHYNLALTLKEMGSLAAAVENFQRTIALKPDHIDAHRNLALAFHEQGKLDHAIECFRNVVSLAPNYAGSYYQLGTTFQSQRKLDLAIEHYQKAVELQPNYVEAHTNLGIALQEQGNLEAAISCFRHALLLKPDCEQMHSNLGFTLQMLGELDAAFESYQHALTISPDSASVRFNLGSLFHYQGKLEQSVESYKKALSLKPDYIEARNNLAFVLLSLGQFKEGWLYSEGRYDSKVKNRSTIAPNAEFPQWQGESLIAKSLLIWFEQGLGDEIQFCRYVSVLKSRGARHISWVCKKQLKSLLKTLVDVDSVYAQDEVGLIAAHDYWTFPLSIPLHCNTQLDNIPANVPYLYANPKQANTIAANLKSMTEFKIGICWKGSSTHGNDAKRSPGIALFKPLFEQPGLKFFTIQPDTRAEFLREVGKNTVDRGHEIDQSNFEEAAALIMNLDLVISCDTSICHLAGALGKPVWIVLPFKADWRWLTKREDSPWYPTMRLFRQAEPGNWDDVFQRVETRLKKVLAKESPVVWPVS